MALTRSQVWGVILLANVVLTLIQIQLHFSELVTTMLSGVVMLVFLAMPWPRTIEQIAQQAVQHLDQWTRVLLRIGFGVLLLFALIGLMTVLSAVERAVGWQINTTFPALVAVVGVALLIFGRSQTHK